MGDLSTRRARVLGTEPVGRGRTLVKAETPQLELVRYATELALDQPRHRDVLAALHQI